MAEPLYARPRVCVFGRSHVVHADGSEAVPDGPNVRELLVFQALHSHVHTDHAVEALWPDTPLHRGRAMLRNVLSRLRARCGPLVVREGTPCAWTPTPTPTGPNSNAPPPRSDQPPDIRPRRDRSSPSWPAASLASTKLTTSRRSSHTSIPTTSFDSKASARPRTAAHASSCRW